MPENFDELDLEMEQEVEDTQDTNEETESIEAVPTQEGTSNYNTGNGETYDMAVEKMAQSAPRYIIHDTCDVIFEEIGSGKVIATTEAQLASISQTVDEQEVRGGIGGAQVAEITSQKTIEASFRDALFSMDYLEMTQGEELQEDMEVTYLVNIGATFEDGKLVLGSDDAEVEEAVFTDTTGAQYKIAFANGESVELPESLKAEEGDRVLLLGRKTRTGVGITIRSDRFPKKFKLTYRTIAYDPTTMEHAKDIIIQFDEVKPSANFDLAFEMSTPIAPEFTLTVLKPVGCNVLGRIVTVDPTNIEEDC